MSWTDRIAAQNIAQLQKDFHISTAVITGVATGGDVELYAHYFKTVYGVDVDATSLEIARNRLAYLHNIYLWEGKSAPFISAFRHSISGTHLFYLDAHYYNPTLKQKWVVIDELKELAGLKDSIIVIHDYDNGLGHLIYDGEPLGWDIVGPYLYQVNPNFHYYTNTLEMCDIYNEQTIHSSKLHVDEHILKSLKYANSSNTKRYRGILYAVPRALDLSKYQLKEGK